MKGKLYLGGIISVLMILTACSGFIINKDTGKSGAAGISHKLALVGGGYLSSDNFNEVSPFLYRDPFTGQAVLFFSSDRDGGNYRIFYSKMTPDGLFYPAVELDSNINVPGFNQTYPVVFYAISYNSDYVTTGTNLFIVYLSESNSNSSLAGFSLGNDFSAGGSVTGFNFSSYITGLGVIPSTYPFGTPTVLVYNGGTSAFEFGFSPATLPFWSDTSNNLNFPQNVNSGSGFIFGYSLYLLLGSGSQISTGYYSYAYNGFSSYPTNGIWNIGVYGSGSRDRDPTVDSDSSYGGYKVYFASDRQGKGNFDLYRYNDNTFDKTAFLLPPIPSLATLLSPITNIITNTTNYYYWTSLYWQPVLGATGYNIYYSTNMDTNYNPFAFNLLAAGIKDASYTWQTNYNDFTNTNGLVIITIKVYSYNGSGESPFGGIAQNNQ